MNGHCWRCGHPKGFHEHLRRGEDCRCGCPEFQARTWWRVLLGQWRYTKTAAGAKRD